jgi:predicted transcriptional regulator
MAGELLTPQDTTTDIPKSRLMSTADIQLMLKLRDDGLTQVQIAQRLGRAQSTISAALDDWEDSTDIARRYLDAQALRMAKNVVEHGMPRDHNVALAGRGVLKSEGAQLNIAVGVSLPGLSLSPPVSVERGEGVENP